MLDHSGIKKCNTCKISKRMADFHAASYSSGDGRVGKCKRCMSSYNKEYCKRLAAQRLADRQIEELKRKHIELETVVKTQEPSISVEELTEMYKKARVKSKRGIYLVSDGNEYVKIGVFSHSAELRLAGLQTGNPRELTLMDHMFISDRDVFEVERQLHQKYAHLRVRGEWFRFSSEVNIRG